MNHNFFLPPTKSRMMKLEARVTVTVPVIERNKSEWVERLMRLWEVKCEQLKP